MTLFIKTMQGETIDIQVERSEAIADVKVMIWDKIGIDPSEQGLVYCGRLIESKEDGTLDDNDIHPDSVIFLTIRMAGC